MRFLNTRTASTQFLTKLAASLLAACLLPISTAHAVNISAYRIYLDESNRETAFVIFNREVTTQDCNLSLSHNNFDADSNLTHLDNTVIPENSAKDWIRFSPLQFTLTPAQSQTVRFTLRRKAGADAGEYRSYLVIDCGVKKQTGADGNEIPSVNLQTKLVHSVPIIVRTGKLEAQVSIENIRHQNGSVSLTLKRTGTRSVYGDIELINKETGAVITSQKNISIYPESERFNIVLGRKGENPGQLKLRYTENKDFGGNIVLEKDLPPQ